MRWNKKPPVKSEKTQTARSQKRGVVGYSKKTALLEEAITQMNTGKYGRSSAALKELLALDPNNMEARRLFATLHLRLGSLIPARQAFDSLIAEAFQRQDYWLAESLLREYLTAAPRCVPFLEKLGQIYEEKGDTLEAVAEYGKAVDILIEDPDTENSQRVSQLYAKIRDLAPASPVAFRLASFFDAQTGELLAPRVTEDPDSIATSTQDSTVVTSEGPGHLEPTNESMPWELPNAKEAVDRSGFPHSSSGASTESFQQATQSFQEHDLSPDSHSSGQTEEKTNDGPRGISSEIHTEELATTPSEASITDPSEQAESGGTLPEIGQANSVEKVSVRQTEIDLTAPQSDAAATQDPDIDSGESREEALVYDSGRPETIALTTDTTNTPEALEDTSAQTPDTVVISSVPMEEVSPSIVPGDPSTANTETSEFWLKPGFSWESVFNKAWKSGNHDTEHAVPPEQEPPRSEELVTQAPAVFVSEDPPQGNQSEDHDERNEQFTPGDAAATGTRIARMPWDQVQESAILIPPAQLDAPTEDTRGLTADQSDDGSGTDGVSAAVEAEGLALLHDSTSDEAKSFSLVRDSEVPPSADPSLLSDNGRAAAELGSIQSPTSVQPETASQEKDSVWIVRGSEPTQSTDSPVLPEIDRTAAEVSASQSSTLAEIKSVSQEEHSFSIVSDSEAPEPQDPPLALEAERAVVDTRPAPSSIEESPVLREPEQHEVPASSSMVDERPVLEAQNATVVEQHLIEELVPNEHRENKAEVQFQIADCALGIQDEPSSKDRESIDQRETIEPASQGSPHSDEAIRETIGEISSFTSTASPPSQPAKQEIQPEPEALESRSAPEKAIESRSWEEEMATELAGRAPTSSPEPETHQEEWKKAEEAIRFVEEPRAVPIAQSSSPMSEPQEMSRPRLAAADAVGVLFESSSEPRKAEARKHAPEIPSDRSVGSILGPIRTALTGFLRTCFSTTRAIVATVIGLMVLSAMGVISIIGGIGLIWTIMEEQPSPVFQSLTTVPQRILSDSKKNGYLVLLGMDAATGQDPAQAGSEQKYDTNGRDAALTCWEGAGANTGGQSSASADVMRKWFRGSDPIGQFKSQQSTIKGWGSEHRLRLDRYGHWQKLPFEDWGYGQPNGPPCATIAFTHQLHVADGFVHSVDQGVDRLETDMEAWRIVLSQARTLPIKMLALQAINDDIAVASGLLVQSDFDTTHLGRVTKLLRPLDQGELSMRWPMQSELVIASKTYDDQLQVAKADADGASTTVASMLPLPKQRRLNEYAKYYEASYKAAGEGQYGSLPKWKDYIQFPATTFMDYLTNPIENVVGLDPLPRWDEYQGLVVDTDARLRLASLQAWLRRGPADGDLLARLAKAGQGFYDPYTGLPMLVNMKKGVLYSVGHDGKDQDGDPRLDVVVEIPVGHAGVASTKSAAGSSKAK